MLRDSAETIVGSARRFFSGTLISRATGFGREVAMAALFGATPAVASFWMAFRFAHLMRRIFGEGALHAAFVPHFERLRQHDASKGARFFYDLSNSLTLLLLSLVVLIECALGSFLFFGHLSSGNQEIIRLTMVFLPALIFICLYALNTSLLNCERSYFLPSVAPAALNVLWIGALFFLWHFPEREALLLLAMVITCAFAVQWLVTMPPVWRYLSTHLGEKQIPFSKREILRLLRPFALGIIGVTATQINSALDALFARAADPEGPAFLWYAIRIQQLPLALFGVSLTGALLPPIARAAEQANWDQYKEFIQFAVQKVIHTMLPITFAIFALGFSGITLAYGRGAFSDEAIVQTTRALLAYGVGLLPMTLVLVFAATFYAQKNYRIPTLLGLTMVGLNVGLNALFVFGLKWGACSIAIATTVAACLHSLLLARSMEGISLTKVASTAVKPLIASLIAAGGTLTLAHTLFHTPLRQWIMGTTLGPFPRTLSHQLGWFGTEALCFATLFFLVTYVMNVKRARV